jgi:hypothetical protein
MQVFMGLAFPLKMVTDFTIPLDALTPAHGYVP